MSRDYLNTAIPQATDEPDNMDDVPPEIMPPVDADFPLDDSSNSDPYYQQAMENSWYQIDSTYAQPTQLPSIQEYHEPVEQPHSHVQLSSTPWNDAPAGHLHQSMAYGSDEIPYDNQSQAALASSSSYTLNHQGHMSHPQAHPHAHDHNTHWSMPAYSTHDLPPIVPPLSTSASSPSSQMHPSSSQQRQNSLSHTTHPLQIASIPIRRRSMYVSERGQYTPQQLSAQEEVWVHPVDEARLAWDYGTFGNGNEGGGGGEDGLGWYGAGHGHGQGQEHGHKHVQSTRSYKYVFIFVLLVCLLIFFSSWDDIEAYVSYESAAERQRLAEAEAMQAQLRAQASRH